MDIDPLSLIAMRSGGDKFGAHLYTPTYHALLAHLRDQPIKLLEIGVGGYKDPNVGGSSLLTWASYFPLGQIIGLDLHEKQLSMPSNVKIYQGSQDDPSILQQIHDECGPFDVIIDDGSHVVDLTRQSFIFLYPKLAATGIYVVEDTQTSFLEETGGQSDGSGSMFQVAHSLSLAMHQAEGYRPSGIEHANIGGIQEDRIWLEFANFTHSISILRNIIVFRRGDNTYPSNMTMDFGHPAAMRNYQIMEKMSAVSSSPRDSLARIDMNIWGRRYDEAALLAILTAEKYPDNLHVLHELCYFMEWAKRPIEYNDIKSRILAAERRATEDRMGPITC
jgi:hypothetical protein